MEEKKWFPLARKSVSTSRNKVFFLQNWISRYPKTEQKSLNKRTLFQLDRESRFPLAGMKNSFKIRIY